VYGRDIDKSVSAMLAKRTGKPWTLGGIENLFQFQVFLKLMETGVTFINIFHNNVHNQIRYTRNADQTIAHRNLPLFHESDIAHKHQIHRITKGKINVFSIILWLILP
jgi:hypothetical protein